MRKLLYLFVLLSGCALSQVSPQIQGAGAPSNPCMNGGQQYVDTTNHVLYGCPSSGSNWANLGLGNVQSAGGTIASAASDPATCNTSDTNGTNNIYYNTVSKAFKYCSNTNTWSAFGAGSGNVGTGQTNVYGAFLQDFSAATMEIPESAAFVSTVDSTVGIDTNTGIEHLWGPGAADSFNMVTAATDTNTAHYCKPTATAGIYACSAIAVGDIPVAIPIANVGSAGLSGTAPVTISAAGAIACATCVVNNGANVGTAAMTINMAASTGTNPFVLQNKAGAAPSAAGAMAYDTTAKMTQISTNDSNSQAVGVIAKTSQKNETTTPDNLVVNIVPSSIASTYRACVVISVSAATSGVISWTLSWTDSNGATQSNIAQDLFQQGAAAPNTTFTTSAAGNYNGCTVFDVNNSGTGITVKWVGGGTTTAKMSATIERIQ